MILGKCWTRAQSEPGAEFSRSARETGRTRMANQQSVKQSGSTERTRKLLSLGEILHVLADIFRFDMSGPVETAYIATVGHRTDEDLNRAYLSVLRTERFMPKPADLLDACGIPKQFRDGTRPE